MPEVALLFSGAGLALYTGMRLGLWAPKSTAALAEVMGPAGKIETIVLSVAVVCIFAAATWFLSR
jgi:hypothetical protein